MADDSVEQPDSSEDPEGSPADTHDLRLSVPVTEKLAKALSDLQNLTDCFCWYWYSYGEKSYGFAVVSAITARQEDEDRAPANGSELRFNEDRDLIGTGTDGSEVPMVSIDSIATIECADGGPVCRFIAAAYAALVTVPPVKSEIAEGQS